MTRFRVVLLILDLQKPFSSLGDLPPAERRLYFLAKGVGRLWACFGKAKMSQATFTALNAAPTFLSGRKVTSKTRAAAPSSRVAVQVSAASQAGRPLWAPGETSSLRAY